SRLFYRQNQGRFLSRRRNRLDRCRKSNAKSAVSSGLDLDLLAGEQGVIAGPAGAKSVEQGEDDTKSTAPLPIQASTPVDWVQIGITRAADEGGRRRSARPPVAQSRATSASRRTSPRSMFHSWAASVRSAEPRATNAASYGLSCRLAPLARR